ncbi:MAG: M28 family peptidase [Deltaproteobacteria bacterium]
MRRLLVVTLLAVSATAVAAPPAPTDTLIAKLLGPTPVLDDLRELTDSIGGRPTGSPAMDKAIDWAMARLRAAGVDDVRAETYVAPRNWLPRIETAEVTSPRYDAQPAERNQLRVAAMPFSPSTPAAGLEAEVFDVGKGDTKGFTGAKGRWALVHTEPMRSIDDLFAEYLATPAIVANAHKAGAAGILWMSNRPHRVLYRHNATLDASMSPVPGALIEREGAERIARFLAAGKHVTVKVTLTVDIQEHASDRNVVAEIKGRDKPDEVILLGAHLDSWDLGRGALDNGCNAALAIDVLRQLAVLAKAGQRPRRTVRIVLFSGEELGLYGSWLDVRTHRADLDKLRAAIIFDEGTGRTTGFSLGGRADLGPAVEQALAPIAGLGPFVQTTDAFIGTDNYDYLLEGVPNLVANQDGPPYLPDYHAETDTFDKVDTRELKANAAIAGALVWGLADADKPPAPRQTRAQVQAIIKATGLDVQMKTFSMWNEFATGKRGR